MLDIDNIKRITKENNKASKKFSDSCLEAIESAIVGEAGRGGSFVIWSGDFTQDNVESLLSMRFKVNVDRSFIQIIWS